LPLAIRSDTIRRCVRRFRLTLAAATLAFWMAPTAVPVLVGLHLLLDDHHAVAHDPADDGHGHDVVSPGHMHDLVLTRWSSSSRPVVTALLGVEIPLPLRVFDAWRTRPQILGHSPPQATLFLSHCSLLI
jgi:hypothetical protein